MATRNKLARIVGAVALPFLVGGCNESLTPVQEQGMYNLWGLGYDYTMQQERNKAIRDSKSEVNVYVNENSTTYAKKPQIYEITNLDTNETILQEDDYWKYINKLEKNGSYPKKGLKILYPEKNGRREWMILAESGGGNYTKTERGEILR